MICATPQELQMHDAIKEMVEAYGEMEKNIEDPIMVHYIGLRLHNAMEDLRALVIPGYEKKYEPNVDEETTEPPAWAKAAFPEDFPEQKCECYSKPHPDDPDGLLIVQCRKCAAPRPGRPLNLNLQPNEAVQECHHG